MCVASGSCSHAIAFSTTPASAAQCCTGTETRANSCLFWAVWEVEGRAEWTGCGSAALPDTAGRVQTTNATWLMLWLRQAMRNCVFVLSCRFGLCEVVLQIAPLRNARTSCLVCCCTGCTTVRLVYLQQGTGTLLAQIVI